jgi:hypothetical protein
MARGWRKLHKGKLNHFNSTSDIITETKNGRYIQNAGGIRNANEL